MAAALYRWGTLTPQSPVIRWTKFLHMYGWQNAVLECTKS